LLFFSFLSRPLPGFIFYFLKLEYISDMQDFYELGYGALPLAATVACPILTDLFTFASSLPLTSSSSGADEPRVLLRFAHDQTVTTLSVLLGLYSSEVPLTGSLSPSQVASRKWRMAEVAPFASNLIFEILSCPAEGGKSTRKIRVRKNEREVGDLPLCPSGTCDLDAWTRNFKCEFEKECNLFA
jgi:hypothetical protein